MCVDSDSVARKDSGIHEKSSSLSPTISLRRRTDRDNRWLGMDRGLAGV